MSCQTRLASRLSRTRQGQVARQTFNQPTVQSVLSRWHFYFFSDIKFRIFEKQVSHLVLQSRLSDEVQKVLSRPIEVLNFHYTHQSSSRVQLTLVLRIHIFSIRWLELKQKLSFVLSIKERKYLWKIVMEFTNFFQLVTDGKALIVCDDDYLSIIPVVKHLKL